MDTSESYIKMCEKAEEIQGQKEKDGLTNGDHIYASSGLDFWHYTGKVEIFNSKPEYVYPLMGATFIPTQDQLQEMFPKQKDFYSDVIFFRDMIRGFGPKFLSHQADSWEQLWLILVMKEKYQKIWNGTDWIKEGV